MSFGSRFARAISRAAPLSSSLRGGSQAYGGWRTRTQTATRAATVQERRSFGSSARQWQQAEESFEWEAEEVADAVYEVSTEGAAGERGYRVKVVTVEPGELLMRPISPWMSIPLFSVENPSLLNMVVEIPVGTNAKMEMSVDDEAHAIVQDLDKHGNLRFIRHGNLPWNYGMLPQTWEDPGRVNADTGYPGDGDPLDVVDVGSLSSAVGQVLRVKLLGALALIDENETDWKILVVNEKDPLADQLNDVDDVERLLPGKIDEIRTWYKVYKVAEGKPENAYALDGRAVDKAYATNIIEEGHNDWVNMLSKYSYVIEEDVAREEAEAAAAASDKKSR